MMNINNPSSQKEYGRAATMSTMARMMTRNRGLAKAPVLLLGMVAIFSVLQDEISSPLVYNNLLPLKGGEVSRDKSVSVYIPPSLSVDQRRAMSVDLGGGNCIWTPPEYDVPEELNFHKTIIAGFPSGDKRMIFVQMEALTGWPAKDEWDFEYLGMSNHPFIKANYPHHEGIWGWEDAADQVVMMIRNIRLSMVEYHDILWDIGYAKTWEEATINLDDLYSEQPPLEDFLAWRDLRVMEECHWYGWFIDYWMEGGLMRDMFTHKITTAEHWNMLMMPTVYTVAELDYDIVVGADTVVTPSYDPHCTYGDLANCEPVAVISAEKLRDYTEGPAETAAIANVLHNDERTGQYVIAPEAWDCIWEELIQNGKGLKTVYDRPGQNEDDYNFSGELLEEMIIELDRLIAKYGSSEWNTKATANRIVSLLSEHRTLIQVELDEVNSGARTLTVNDFLGPKERASMRELKPQATPEGESPTSAKDYSAYFTAIERKAFEKKRGGMSQQARQEKAGVSESAGV